MMPPVIRPLLSRLDGLPEPQAVALGVALGLRVGPRAPDPFLVSLAVLTLLSDAGGPVLCLVDDVQWMDRPSADVLAFVVRRLREEPIVVLAADRLDRDRHLKDFFSRTVLGDSLMTAGLPERRLAGLEPDAAAVLLMERSGIALAPAVRDALLRAADGNPLALIELPGTLRPAQLAGTEPLPEPLPLAGELERVFATRISQLARGARTLLLLCACSGRRAAITRAAATLGVDPADLNQLRGLVRIEDATVVFAHPLIRSAVCSPPCRTAATRMTR